MNIVHVGNFKSDSANGVNQCIYNIAINQALLGHSVCVYSFEDISEIKEDIKEGVRHIKFPKNYFKGFKLSKTFKEYVLLNHSNIDVVHLHSVFMPINNSIASMLRKLNINYVITPHGGYSYKCLHRSKISYVKKKIYMFFFEKKYINNAQKIHALNKNEEKEFINIGIDKKRIITVPNGINKVENLKHKTTDTKIKYITFMGRLDKVHKGLDYLLEGFNIFIKKHDKPNYKLIIAGPDEKNHLKDLKKYVEKNKIQEHVVFKGRVRGDEKEELLLKSDIFIHTSRWEGMPIALLEALSYGIPLIITKETNIGDFITNYNAGKVVDLDKYSIANALENIMNENIAEMSVNSIYLANKEFDWSINTNKLTESYK